MKDKASDLIYAIRRMGGRIYVEDRPEGEWGAAGPYVLVEAGPVPLPRDMLEKAKAMKADLVKRLNDVRDPEYRAYRAFVSAWGVSKYKSLALMLAGFRQRLHGGE